MFTWVQVPRIRTLFRDSHPLATRHSHKSLRHYSTLIGSFSTHFHTLVSTLQHFPLLHTIQHLFVLHKHNHCLRIENITPLYYSLHVHKYYSLSCFTSYMINVYYLRVFSAPLVQCMKYTSYLFPPLVPFITRSAIAKWHKHRAFLQKH